MVLYRLGIESWVLACCFSAEVGEVSFRGLLIFLLPCVFLFHGVCSNSSNGNPVHLGRMGEHLSSKRGEKMGGGGDISTATVIHQASAMSNPSIIEYYVIDESNIISTCSVSP